MLKQYVDLSMLKNTPNNQNKRLIINQKGEIIAQPRAPLNVDTIEQWTDLFIVYSSIYLAAHPEKTQALFKYMHIVRTGEQRHGGLGFRDYDEQFRFRVGMNPNKDWSVMDGELRMLYMQQPVKQNISKNTKAGMKCYDFNYKGDCQRRQCLYSHRCMKFFGDHPQILCPRVRDAGQPGSTFCGSHWQSAVPQGGYRGF